MSDHLTQTAATMTRVGLAAEALVWWLGGDPRVQSAYIAWRLSHGLLPGAMLTADSMRSVHSAKEHDTEALDRLVQHDLGLNYRWLAPLLLFDFAVTVVGSEGVRLTPEDVGLPPGRRPKADTDYIGRDVEWFYRATIKRPKDSIRKLGREHLEKQGGAYGGDGRAAVQAGINRVKLWLDVLTLDDVETVTA